MQKTYRMRLEQFVDGVWEDQIVDTIFVDESIDITSGKFQAFEKKVRDFIRSLNG